MTTLSEWQSQRAEIRRTLHRLLGDIPPAFTPEYDVVQRVERDDYAIETITFQNGLGDTVYVYLLLPGDLSAPRPAVLYLHYHGGQYHLGKGEALLDRVGFPAPGIALVKAGFVVLVIDSYAFGERRLYEGRDDAEQSYVKQFLWQGRTLWGMIVHDDLLALNLLADHPAVDGTRISAMGMSMGGSRSTWLAALDDRLHKVIPIAQMTRYADFAASKAYNLHSIYYYLPGVLTSGIDMEHLTALAAPRRQLVLIGGADALSPIEGIRKIEAFTRHIYDLYDASQAYRLIEYPGLGHDYTPEMFREAMRWLENDSRSTTP
jgi:dienelactone hydrolase